MEKERRIRLNTKLKFLSIPLIILILDQITKRMIVNSMWLGDSRRIIGDFLRFTYIRNPNSVFGLSFGGPVISTILTIVAFIFVIYLFITVNDYFFLTAVSFIIGGAMGNLVDRFLYMEVIDFIDMGIGGYRWATYNVADSFVTIGIILVIIHWFLETRNVNSATDSV